MCFHSQMLNKILLGFDYMLDILLSQFKNIWQIMNQREVTKTLWVVAAVFAEVYMGHQ